MQETQGLRELALFAGCGGGILGGKMLGWRTVAAVEIEPYCLNTLRNRQDDGLLDRFPLYTDVRTFDGRPWRGKVDVISGGFPCQDISIAGHGLGIERGERSGLWREYARIVREVRPRYVFVENSPRLTRLGLGIVLADLAASGYDAAWKVLSAAECGAPHQRDRMWIVARLANPVRIGSQRSGSKRCLQGQAGLRRRTGDDEAQGLPDAEDARPLRRERILRDARADGPGRHYDAGGEAWGRKWWKAEPGMGRMAHGVANRVDRIKAIGNGQVPIVAARAFVELKRLLEEADDQQV